MAETTQVRILVTAELWLCHGMISNVLNLESISMLDRRGVMEDLVYVETVGWFLPALKLPVVGPAFGVARRLALIRRV